MRLRRELERTSIRTELETAIPGFKGVGVVVFVETLKAVFNRVVLCLRSKIGISIYVRYNRDSRKRERPPFTMTLRFEFERKRLYVITHDLPVT